ncbi:hypothetical protein EJ08DRAFT_662194 [Tothia fuscella]|uniref:Zn(2)-C6 fungal-type domain-containing protein n=1 Tax=Tothia fuscella TaxID=1048955 RepID=A0A9P4NP70_9PEZI|nr:hypothetical protein EJ08DRAFT_662194 [Tothia fuscella]
MAVELAGSSSSSSTQNTAHMQMQTYNALGDQPLTTEDLVLSGLFVPPRRDPLGDKASKKGRKKGKACGLCREQRVKCDSGNAQRACLECLKRASCSQSIGVRICVNYDTRALESRERFIDFFNSNDNSSRFRLLRLWYNSQNSNRWNLSFCFPPLESNGITYVWTGKRMQLAVQGCSDPTIDSTKRPTLDVVTVPRPKEHTRLAHVYDNLPSDFTYYIAGPLPTIDTLLKWGEQGLIWRADILADDVECCLDMLLLAYRDHNPALPLHGLVRDILNTAILARFFIVGQAPVELLEGTRLDGIRTFTNRTSGTHHTRPFADMSHPARQQILILAARAYVKYEESVLQRIDRLVFAKKAGLLLPRYTRGRDMYDTMIRHYRHVFRETLTPFHEDWKLEKHKEALQDNSSLIDQFERLRLTEAKHFNSELVSEDDGVYLGMFLQKPNRQGRSPAKTLGRL